MNNSIRIERLKRLIHVLKIQERAAAKFKPAKLNGISAYFNMDRWCAKLDTQYIKHGSCGTAACALGSAALNDWFKRRGLTMEFDMADFEYAESVSQLPHKAISKNLKNKHINEVLPVDHGHVVFKGEEDFDAGAEFFGIELWESEWLFDPYEYSKGTITPARVIKRVQDVLVHYQKGKPSSDYKDAYSYNNNYEYNLEQDAFQALIYGVTM